MNAEGSLDVETYIDILSYLLDLYKTSLGNLVCLIADNRNKNNRVSDLCSVPLVGCVSHRFHLAAKEV